MLFRSGGVKTSSSAGNISASACRSISRVSGKDGKCSRAGFSRVGCLILIKLRLFGVIFLFMDAEFLEKL